jgi:uncharacterized protein YggE
MIDVHRSLTAALAAAVLALPALALPAAAQQGRVRPQITVTGEAIVSIAPDMAQLRAGVTTDAKTAQDAAQANAKAMAAVMAAIQGTGIAERDVQTARYTIHPVYDTGKQARDRITGFQAVNSVLIKVRQPDQTGEIIDKLFAAGANTVGGIDFTVTDPSKALDQARGEAVADARRKAKLYAGAAGVELGGVVTITEQSAGMQPPPMMMMRAAAPAAPETPVSPGERQFHVSVSVTYDLNR